MKRAPRKPFVAARNGRQGPKPPANSRPRNEPQDHHQRFNRILKGFPNMITRAVLLAGGLLAASFAPALCDSVTATAVAWDPTSRTITLDDKSQFSAIPKTITVPDDLSAGDQVTIDYEALDNGVDSYNSVTVIKDIAKRLTPNDKRG
jgi:hypothetical protein